MQIFQYIKSHKLISFIILLVIILLIYFLVINKSNSSSETPNISPTDSNQTQNISPMDPDTLGFVTSETVNRIDRPKIFIPMDMFNMLSYGKEADNGIINTSSQVQYKWSYDKKNIFFIERTILNTNNSYSQNELSALGKTYRPNTYMVNQIIPSYDKNNINLSRDVVMTINPMILTTYANYKLQ
jgi:hypothetical protein